MNILLIDAYSAQHIGNLALVDSALEQLKIKFPEAEFTILSFDPVSIAKYSRCRTLETLWAEQFSGYSFIEKVAWIVRESLWVFANVFNLSVLKRLGLMVKFDKYTFSKKKLAALKAYSDADIVVSISGEALQDSEWKRVPLFLFGYWLAYKLEKVVAIFPQSIGPLKKGFIRVLVGYVLNLCDLVLPRDEFSFQTVRNMKINPRKTYLVPDLAVKQPYIPLDQARRLLESQGVKLDKRPLIGMAISKWEDIKYEGYFLTMQQLCRFILDQLNGSVVFFLANRRLQKDLGDWDLTQKLYELFSSRNNVTLLSKEYTPRECKGMLGQLDLFISTRMHVAIFATMAGTPTITVNTQLKLQGYMNLIHQGNRSCDVNDFTILKAIELLKDSLAHSEEIRAALKNSRIELEKQTGMASELLRIIYDQKNKLSRDLRGKR
ncbi:MAG: polysaccharide pyruvyl transferase family protein [Candidatus Omnitrophica bacterium]|jgi:polysaccharide pyruvyl transferase WcaK-like protein|nr:polysaccharide pyruvyl transferase family protein [Candidatus Omnitrophota bacterium]